MNHSARSYRHSSGRNWPGRASGWTVASLLREARNQRYSPSVAEGELRAWLHVVAEPVVDEFLAGQGGKLVKASVEGPLVNDYLHTITFGQFAGFIKPERLMDLDIDVISPSWAPSCIFKGR